LIEQGLDEEPSPWWICTSLVNPSPHPRFKLEPLAPISGAHGQDSVKEIPLLRELRRNRLQTSNRDLLGLIKSPMPQQHLHRLVKEQRGVKSSGCALQFIARQVRPVHLDVGKDQQPGARLAVAALPQTVHRRLGVASTQVQLPTYQISPFVMPIRQLLCPRQRIDPSLSSRHPKRDLVLVVFGSRPCLAVGTIDRIWRFGSAGGVAA
jgi:hypothetical protein